MQDVYTHFHKGRDNNHLRVVRFGRNRNRRGNRDTTAGACAVNDKSRNLIQRSTASGQRRVRVVSSTSNAQIDIHNRFGGFVEQVQTYAVIHTAQPGGFVNTNGFGLRERVHIPGSVNLRRRFGRVRRVLRLHIRVEIRGDKGLSCACGNDHSANLRNALSKSRVRFDKRFGCAVRVSRGIGKYRSGNFCGGNIARNNRADGVRFRLVEVIAVTEEAFQLLSIGYNVDCPRHSVNDFRLTNLLKVRSVREQLRRGNRDCTVIEQVYAYRVGNRLRRVARTGNVEFVHIPAVVGSAEFTNCREYLLQPHNVDFVDRTHIFRQGVFINNTFAVNMLNCGQ